MLTGGWLGHRYVPELTRTPSAPLSPGDVSKAFTAEQKGWALATSAVLTERNGQRHDVLGGTEPTPAEVAYWKGILQGVWGVRSRHDLLRTLAWLETAGHRRQLEALGSNPPSGDSGSDPQLAHRVALVRAHYARLGKRSLLGWDYGRYVSLCRWGYLVGYLSEDEAWQRIMPKARELQDTFESWADLGENYLVGREFWSLEETAKNGHLYRAAYHKLIADPQSPWGRLPWKLDLRGTPV